MNDAVTFNFDPGGLVEKKLGQFATELSDGRIPLSQCDRVWKADVARAQNKVKADTGGKVRGKTQAPMKPQYVRKDGTVVPAWGGVAKVRGRGKVKGKRRRPKGSRVARTSVINKDTGELMAALVGSRPFLVGKRQLLIGARLPKQASVFEHGNRDPMYFTRENRRQFGQIGEAHVRKLVKRLERRGR